jgi:hypothetical protein
MTRLKRPNGLHVETTSKCLRQVNTLEQRGFSREDKRKLHKRMKVGKPASRSGSDIHKGRIARASIFSKPGLKAQAKRKGFQRGLNLRSHDSNDATQKVTTLWKTNGKEGWKIRKDLPTHLQSFETLKRKPHECSWFEK